MNGIAVLSLCGPGPGPPVVPDWSIGPDLTALILYHVTLMSLVQCHALDILHHVTIDEERRNRSLWNGACGQAPNDAPTPWEINTDSADWLTTDDIS